MKAGMNKPATFPASQPTADAFLETAPLLKLVNEHSALGRWLNLPAAECWADQHAEKSARLAEVWAAIGRRFPAYIERQLRLADERAEHEARVRRAA